MSRKFKEAVFHPVIGKDYENSSLGFRLLILGESHYEWESMPKKKSETTKCALGDGDKRFWKKIVGLFGENDSAACAKFWNSVAFYNYIQEFVGDGPRKRPTMWTSHKTIAGFKEVLRECDPDRVLVLGKDNWRMMAGKEHFPEYEPMLEGQFKLPSSFSENLVEQYAYWYPTTPQKFALCAPIYHPAYPHGFHGKDTLKVVKKLCDKKWANVLPSAKA